MTTQLAAQSNSEPKPTAPVNYLQLRQSPKIWEVPEQELKRHCYDIVVAAFTHTQPLGKQDADTYIAHTSFLVAELRQGRFCHLTIDEIRQAFHEGVRKEFGDYFGLTPVTYHQFLNGFLNCQKRREALKMLSFEMPAATKKEFTIEEKRQIAVSNLEHYQNTKELPPCPHAIYDIVCELFGADAIRNGKRVKTLIPNDSDAIMLLELAKKEYQTELKRQHFQKYKQGQCLFTQELQRLNGTFEFRLKKHYLKFYFDKLIADGKELQ
ncbi:MAG: hypothetical protein PSX36_06765 [bacterium]|nr:hypothetical protein [bacterium]